MNAIDYITLTIIGGLIIRALYAIRRRKTQCKNGCADCSYCGKYKSKR